jgi:hypothetical protein
VRWGAGPTRREYSSKLSVRPKHGTSFVNHMSGVSKCLWSSEGCSSYVLGHFPMNRGLAAAGLHRGDTSFNFQHSILDPLDGASSAVAARAPCAPSSARTGDTTMYYLTFDGSQYDLSDDLSVHGNADGATSSPRQVLVRADRFAEGLAALEAGVTVATSAAAADDDDEESQQRAGIAKLTYQVSFSFSVEDRSAIERRNHRMMFGRFVDLLAQTMLPGSAAIRTFKIEWSLSWEEECRETDLDRLFRDVLPNHPTIDRIQLGRCPLPARFVRRLTSSVPSTGRATPLLELTLSLGNDPANVAEGVRAICDMLRRNVPLRALSLLSNLTSAHCQSILRSLSENTHLEGLAIRPRWVNDDTLCLASESAPALRALHVSGHFPPGGAESLARQLRTNTTLVELRLWVMDLRDFEALVGDLKLVVTTYNFTIRSLRFEPPPSTLPWRWPSELTGIAARLRRNDRIHQALEQFPAYREAPAAVCPQALEPLPTPRGAWTVLLPGMMGMVCDLPTLLFRFLRKSDISDLYEHLVHAEANRKGGGTTKKIRTA